MRAHRHARHAALTLVCAALGASPCVRLQAGASAAPIPLGGAEATITVPVTVNGSGPYSFVLDTGSSHTAVSTALAARLGLPRVAKARVSSTAGDAWAAVDRVAQLGLGGIERHDLLATELPAAAIEPGGTADGIVGLDLLGDRRFCIDVAARRLTWEWPSLVAAAAELPLETDGPVWLVPGSVGRRQVRLVPDSGADGLVLFDRGSLPGLAYVSGTVGVSTVTNRTSARPARLDRLNLGRLALVDLPVAVLDGRAVGPDHGDGLLPLRGFDQACFDPAGGRLRLAGSSAAGSRIAGLRMPGVPAE